MTAERLKNILERMKAVLEDLDEPEDTSGEKARGEEWDSNLRE